MNHPTPNAWTITGADNQLIYGDTHLPASKAKGVVLLAHGLKSYKDYGFQPALAAHLAKEGLIVHRFNFSHSGMTNDLSTFARPDLFEQDTWNKQVADIQKIAAAVRRGALPGALAGNVLPQVWIGHSRGGTTTLLAASRAFNNHWPVQPAAVVTLAACDSCCRLSENEQKLMHQEHGMDMLSARTGQVLRQGEAWLSEQEADPDAHNPIKAVGAIQCPLLIVHGKLDESVAYEEAVALKQAADQSPHSHATLVSLPEANHTFNAPNPLPLDKPVPALTLEMFEQVESFIQTIV